MLSYFKERANKQQKMGPCIFQDRQHQPWETAVLGAHQGRQGWGSQLCPSSIPAPGPVLGDPGQGSQLF